MSGKPNRVKEQALDHTYLISIVSYEPSTGMWRWLRGIPHTKIKAGDIAGAINKDGYRYIRINGVNYLSSRLAFFYMTKEWPDKTVDHKNQVRDDDRWENLEQKDDTEQNHNRGLQKNNVSGVKGVFFDNINDKWVGKRTLCLCSTT